MLTVVERDTQTTSDGAAGVHITGNVFAEICCDLGYAQTGCSYMFYVSSAVNHPASSKLAHGPGGYCSRPRLVVTLQNTKTVFMIESQTLE